MKLAIYNENCVQAGRQVGDRELEQAEADNEGRDCDPWEGGDWTIHEGTSVELLDFAGLLERHAKPGSLYTRHVARTIREAVYAEEPDLEPVEEIDD